MNKHTPVPWTTYHDPEGPYWVITAGSMHVPITYINEDEETDADNAAFIVRACNSHDKMLKALTEIERIAAGKESKPPIMGEGLFNSHILGIARVAIADATGGKL